MYFLQERKIAQRYCGTAASSHFCQFAQGCPGRHARFHFAQGCPRRQATFHFAQGSPRRHAILPIHLFRARLPRAPSDFAELERRINK